MRPSAALALLLAASAGAAWAQGSASGLTQTTVATDRVATESARSQLRALRARVQADRQRLQADRAAGNSAATHADAAQLHADRAAFRTAREQVQGNHAITGSNYRQSRATPPVIAPTPNTTTSPAQ